MPGKSLGHKKSMSEEIDELQRKTVLYEGDRVAYYQSAEWTIMENKQTIEKLRRENKELRKNKKKSLDADEHVVNQGLEECPDERKALRTKSGPTAIRIMDYKVSDKVNVLNNLKYKSTRLQKRLEELQTQHDQMQKDAENAAETDAGESDEAQRLRSLENRLDKANLKCKEAEHIRRTYCQIKHKLEEEHQNFETTLDEMEQEIQRLRAENKQLQVMHNDACISRDAAKAQLEKEEKEVYAEKKKREVELAKVKKEAEDKKLQYERIERRQAARGEIEEDMTAEQRNALLGEEEQHKITTYDEMFKRIKDATGVSDTQEVVARFEGQGDTTDHLEDLKKENEKNIFRLKEDKEKHQREFEEMKYSGEAKLSSGQRMLEEFETHLQDEEKRCAEAQERLEKSSKILLSASAGVDHMSEKLKHLKAASSQVGKSKINQSSDEYVLDQLSICEEKLLKLLEDLDASGKDLTDMQKQMEEEEFHNTMETHLPTHNTRVKLPTSEKDNLNYEDEEDSGEDADAPTRMNIKKQAQQLIDSKTKRRMVTKKKKSKN